MFAVYDIVTKPLTTDLLSQEPCPTCRTKGGVEVTLYMKYMSMIVPFFSLGRRTGVMCTLCGDQIKDAQAGLYAKNTYSPAIATAINAIKSNYKRTLWQLVYPWSVFFIFGVLVAGDRVNRALSTASKDSAAATRIALLANPQPGDIYAVDFQTALPDKSYKYKAALVKLVRVSGDSMYVVISKQTLPENGAWRFKGGLENIVENARKGDAFWPTEYKVDLSTFARGYKSSKYMSAAEPGSLEMSVDDPAAKPAIEDDQRLVDKANVSKGARRFYIGGVIKNVPVGRP